MRVAAAEALLDWGYERYAEVAPGGGRRGGRDRVARPKLDDSDATPSLEPLADDERTVTLEGAVDEETVTTTIGELAHAAIDGVPVQARG